MFAKYKQTMKLNLYSFFAIFTKSPYSLFEFSENVFLEFLCEFAEVAAFCEVRWRKVGPRSFAQPTSITVSLGAL
ncbi:hypothetical protein [Acanthopleuribacter pedis]|uniref:Uncharacterized protein n=1 Tax=Acanthopleuribacter pedis TaxID=442870 RepID=A0A8J7U3W4_9BACT|nr:hypothetical protein [Acanthopleuribacter pedis]MBO1320868.1 hypothetical protein [Acanthopleuribacter pedis]